MKKGLITAALGLGMLYAQAASAGEMVRYDHALFLADAGAASSSTKAKSAKPAKPAKNAQGAHHHRHHHHKHHHNHHHHKHHHHKHYRQDCDRCGGMYMNQAVMAEPMAVEQVEPHMDIINRNHGTRGGRGR